MLYKAPRGTADLLPGETGIWQEVEQILRTVSDLYHFKEIRLPLFETTELFTRSVGDTSDIVNKEMYTFADKKGRSLTLRPEGTAGLVRAFVEHKLYAALPAKFYYMGPMFRYERPQRGRQRQFHQYGVEMLGVEDPLSDAEIMDMAVTIVKALGIQNVRLVINSLGDKESRARHKEALQKHFAPHLEELCADCQNRFEKNPLRMLDCKVDQDKECMKNAPQTLDYLTPYARDYFAEVRSYLDDLGIAYTVDPHLVRGLDYYNHTVFEVISDDPRFTANTAIGGGGRYSGLVKELGGPDVPGIGFAFGLERLCLARQESARSENLDVYIITLEKAARSMSLQLISMLRANGYRCDMDYENRSLKAQLKSADRYGAKFVIIIGEDEMKSETLSVKYNRVQEAVPLENIVAYLDGKMEEEL